MGLATTWLERHHVGAIGHEWELTFLERSLVAGRAITFYAGKLIWPRDLIFNYPRWTVDATVWWQWIYPLGAIVTVVGLWALRHRVGRAPLVGFLFFYGTLFPALGFFDVYAFRYSFVADHFQYLASIGLLALLVGAMARAASKLPRPARRVAAVLGAVVLVLLGVKTWHQAQDYRDIETLWVATLDRNPRSWMAHINLGKQLAREGQLDEAALHPAEATSIRPDNDKAHHNLGFVLARQARTGAAIESYSTAIRINPDHGEARINLGNLLAGLERFDEAILHYSEALRIMPGNAEVHNNLANALAGQGRFDEAIEQYMEALRIDPGYAAARQNLDLARQLQRDARTATGFEP
jgi:tetratricopeptide (TPR) repeat protein